MGSIGFGEVAFLAVLGLLIFGPDRLPEIARNVGKAIGALKREANATLDELKRSADFDEFRAVTDEMRQTGSSLRDDLRGLTSTATTSAVAAPGASGPAPFDPDAP